MPILYVVATSIGNLDDISKRALDTLQQVDYILCEDTRVSSKLLARFNIQKPLIAYHQHSKLEKISYIIGLLKQGKNLALISDAGTPGISDPGGKLVQEIINLAAPRAALGAAGEEIRIVPIPGPSALTTLASVCGFSMDKFLFLGFPPHKKGRKKFFEEVASSPHPVIFYESCHRILKTLAEFGAQKEPSALQVVVGRELTKKFETIYRGTIDEVAKKIESGKVGGSIKGEFVIAIKNLKGGN